MGKTFNNICLFLLLIHLALAGNQIDQLFQLAEKRFDQIYFEHSTYVANGHSVQKGQIGCAHFTREAISPMITKLYNESLTTVIACIGSVRLGSANLSQPLTNYEKPVRFCESINSQVPVEDKCDILSHDTYCDKNYEYRSIDGYCNNLRNPKIGAQLTPYSRLIPGNFDDGARSPPKSCTKEDLPKPRYMGNILFAEKYTEEKKATSNYFAILFGQFIAHDAGERGYYQLPPGGPDFQACTADNSQILPPESLAFASVPIEVPADDPYLSKFNVGCLNFVRTQPMYRTDCKFSSAEFTNLRTHYLDCSNLYGSVNETALKLREMKDGKMKTNEFDILPQSTDSVPESAIDYDGYYAAEHRVLPFYTLTLIHVVFLRFHNQIATELKLLNPSWDDERLYQESRRIVIAVYQHIVYSEWIPLMFGMDFAVKYNLYSPNQLYCGAYSSAVDPSASNEFSHAAYRQFHMNIPDYFNYYDDSMNIYKTIPLYETDNGPKILETDFNGVLRGLVNDPIKNGPGTFSDTIRNKVFDNFNPKELGLDMPSNDILVGRDHGLSSYTKYLIKYSGRSVQKWEDLAITIPKDNIEKLKSVYSCVDDIDLYVGLAMEHRDYTKFKYLGPVGKHIIGEQFNRFKLGDRFFYCSSNNGNRFTRGQLTEISKMSLARVLCQTVDIADMLPKAFGAYGSDNNWTNCKHFKAMDLNAWKEKRYNWKFYF